MKVRLIISTLLLWFASFTATSCNVFHKKITVSGKALNDKDGAILKAENGIYMLHKIGKWDENVYEKEVAVTGYLVVKTFKKRSTPELQVQERVGKVNIIKKPKWKIVK